MAENWRNIWHVPDKRHYWRRELNPAGEDKFFGNGTYPTKEAAEARGHADEQHFSGELGMSVSYLGAQRCA